MTGSLTKIALAALAISVGTVRYSFAQAPAAKDTAGAATAKRSAEAAGKAPAEKPIEGSLTLGGKTYKLVSVAAYETKFFDEAVVNVLACDKAIPIDKLKAALAKDGTDDSFMLWEPNVKVTFKKNGEPMSMNSWAGGASLSVSGGGISGELAVKDGVAHGKFALASDDKGKCDFTFNVPMTAAPAAKKNDAKKTADVGGSSEQPKGSSAGQSAEEEPAKPAKPKPTLNIYKLPLPKDAANIEYKTLVEQLKFTSGASHTALAKSFSAQLAAAGWTKVDSDLVGKSAILKRKQGAAELTIMIKPAETGSSIIVFAENMNWDKPTRPEAVEEPKK